MDLQYFDAEDKAAILGVTMGSLGLVWGAVIGASIGHRYVETSRGADVPRVSVSPTNGGAMAQAGWTF